MDVSVEELAAMVGGRVAGDSGSERTATVRITGAASIFDAAEGDLAFFANVKYLAALRSTRATCVLVPEDFQEAISAILIHVPNPMAAFALVMERFTPPPVVFCPGIHPSVVVGEGVQLGAGVSIQPHVVIEPGAVIGEGTVLGANAYIGHSTKVGAGCLIYPNVIIRERCIVGNRVIIHPGTVIGSDGFGFELKEGRHVKVPQTGFVQIDDDVEIGANCAMDRGRFGRTWIGEGTKVDNLVHVGHNVVVGKHVLLVAQVGISGSTRVGNYATLAGQAGVAGHLEIGEHATVGAQGGVTRSVPAKQFWWGTPARPMEEFKERYAHAGRLPQLADRISRLEEMLEEFSKKQPPA